MNRIRFCAHRFILDVEIELRLHSMKTSPSSLDSMIQLARDRCTASDATIMELMAKSARGPTYDFESLQFNVLNENCRIISAEKIDHFLESPPLSSPGHSSWQRRP